MYRIYEDNGYIDIPAILSIGAPFTFVVGGRATGKTFGALRECKRRYRDLGSCFMLLRRTQAQVDIIGKQEYSPFKAVDRKDPRKAVTVCKPLTKYTTGVYEGKKGPEGIPEIAGPCIGYIGALSTFSNIRGFDGSDVDLIVYDEFIPESHERPIKDEAGALFNAYETINRNRELEGLPPCQLLCLANANDLGNPVFLALGLVRKAEEMRRKGQEVWIDRKRGVCLIILQDSPISDAKGTTALYKLVGNGEFADMSLNNNFAGAGENKIMSIPLKQLTPIVEVGEITIYRIKGQREIYVSCHHSGNPPTFGTGPSELKRFSRAYSWVWQSYMLRRIIFEERLGEILLLKYLTK